MLKLSTTKKWESESSSLCGCRAGEMVESGFGSCPVIRVDEGGVTIEGSSE